jgi:PAS domain S-box-containing protein
MSQSLENSMKHTSRKRTILIVDDNPTNLGVLTNYLKEYGYKTPVASNGEIALKRAKYIHPDLILLDVMMPGIDGFETCHRLKADENTKDIPVIFMTALESTENKVRGFQEGAVDYITKPLQYEEVLARVTTHLHIRELTQHLQRQTAELASANTEIRYLNEQLRAENLRVIADLKESEHKYKTLVEEITDGYFVIQDGVIVFANQAFCHMHGYQLEEVLGKPFTMFVDPESRKETADIYHKTHQEMTVSRLFEYLRLTKGGHSLSTEMTVKATYYENKLVDIGICRDITERIQMEQRVRDAERMADIGRITTSLSHELRNPLSAIKMNLQILKKNHQFADNDQRRIDISVREVGRLEGVLNELLDFAKPLHLNMSTCNINTVLSSCLELLNETFEEKQLSVTRYFDPNIPDFRGDEKKLSQAFINLLLNASEVSNQEGKIWVTSQYCHPDPDNPQIEVIVQDEGCGLPKQELSEIFKPFFTTKTHGTGLGLTNVKQAIEAHGGRVEAGNRHPSGASFRVYLPVHTQYKDFL